MSRPGLPWAWGATDEDWAQTYPCDELEPDGVRLVRAVRCAAPPSRVWPWLCQLRVAPYSYDLLDNCGRRSPRRLDPDLPPPRVGDRFLTIFDVSQVESARSLTLRMRPGRPRQVFGDLQLSYVLRQQPAGCRLVGAIRLVPQAGPVQAARRYALAWGDLVMMRRQLRTLASLAAGAQQDGRAGTMGA